MLIRNKRKQKAKGKRQKSKGKGRIETEEFLDNRGQGIMKKDFYGMAILLTFFLVSSAHGDYLIKLKNGRSVGVEKYWEEKGEIKFQYQGGVASLPKNNILSIVSVEERFPERVNRQEDPSPAQKEVAEEPKKPEAKGKEESAVRKEASKAIDVDYYKKQKAFYMEQYEQAYQRYMDATSRKDAEAKKKAWEEFNDFGGKVFSLETELRKKNNGVVPQWWKE